MLVRVQKWGNSLAVRIPRSFAAETGIEAGCPVEMTVTEGELRLRPIRSPTYRLDDLLEAIAPDNVPGEVDFGPSAGREAW